MVYKPKSLNKPPLAPMSVTLKQRMAMIEEKALEGPKPKPRPIPTVVSVDEI